MSQLKTPGLARLFEEFPAAAEIFRTLGLETTRPDISLEEASRAIPSETRSILLHAARQVDTAGTVTDWSVRTLSEIIAHTVEFHHKVERECVALLSKLLVQLTTPDSAAQSTVDVAFSGLAAKMIVHFREEEEILFPYILALDEAYRANRAPLAPPFKSSCSPLHAIRTEHHGILDALIMIRQIVDAIEPPDGSRIGHLALRLGLDALDKDLREHVYIEEAILFPRAVEVEKALCVDAA